MSYYAASRGWHVSDVGRIKSLQAELDGLLTTAATALANAQIVSARLNERLADLPGELGTGERERDPGSRQIFGLWLILKAGGGANGDGWAPEKEYRRLLAESGQNIGLSALNQTLKPLMGRMFITGSMGRKLTVQGQGWAEQYMA